jgi:hypothetical protein
MRLPQGRPERRDRPWLLLATLLPTWGLWTLGGRGRKRAHHHANHVMQRQPRTLFRTRTHCSCCLRWPTARRESRWAMCILFFAAAARRQTCTAGASTTLGDDDNADATKRGGTTPDNADATGRLMTDADATERSRKRCNADATTRTGTCTGTLPNPTTQRGYKATLDRSVTLETPVVGKRRTEALRAITAS